MARTELDTLILRVRNYFRRHAAQYGLDSDTVEARYILNWGGFVNASFVIQDGQRANGGNVYHLKLADDEEVQQDLQRWQVFHQRLSSQYHAPRLLNWISIPHTPFAGLLFAFIPGRPVDFTAQPEILQAVLALLPRLHSDKVLATALEHVEGGIPTCADYFLSVYIDRLDEDMLVIAGNLPPFVSLDLLSWMMGETRELEGLARDLAAFQQPANAPTHGDLWPSNVLVTQEGDWYIIDWDDLALGDPALEYSIVLGPLWRRGSLSLEEAVARLPSADADLRTRFEVCLRALLLDEVIDTLADWVESGFSPEHQEEVRAAKERTHREALDLYRQRYPE